MFKKLKAKWPLVLKKTYEAQQRQHRETMRLADERYARAQEEWQNKWKPLLDKMMTLEVSKYDHSNQFMAHVTLDRGMMEHAARFNDEAIWKYMAKVTGVHLECQLATMNFAGLYRMASEFEDRRYRGPTLMPITH